MAVAIYDISVPVFTRTLRAQAKLCDIAATHCQAHGVPAAELLGARLAPDMQPLAFQFAAMINNSVLAVARLQGSPMDSAEPVASFPAVSDSLTAALAWLAATSPEDLKGSEAREIVLPHPRGTRRFSGLGYLTSLALPGFFFHAATAYDILRHRGLEIGKRDFLGELPPREPVAA